MRNQFRGINTFHLSKPQTRKVFVFLLLATALIFAFVGAFAMFQAKTSIRSSSFGKVTSQIQTKTLLMLISQTLPYLREQKDLVNHDHLFSRLFFEITTSINPRDPRTFLGRELPLFTLFDTEIDVASADVDFSSIPIESPPPPQLEEEIIRGVADAEWERQREEISGPSRKKILIYHTHFWESYLPEINEKDPRLASSLQKNVMQIGKRMANRLNQMGIGAVTMDRVPKTGWVGSYQHSRVMAVNMMKKYKDITYLIDIHRDSRRRKQTTIEIEGKTYARLAFVVGEASKNFEKNRQLAREMHNKINQRYPGLSRGVVTKKRANGNNGEYNQSLSPNSMLVEVGGVDNTFEEGFRSIEVLAEVLGEKLLQAIPVSTK
ncbi:stage II sporulation protein P [Thermoflavimicrobium dichotomicum]|uniref:Stage II sporulation protein P n=1 Tax=Thermoflavimicrobium dichotomicum TaxID=46223 RepID=A0A1I3NKD7_9BACL|nr:stage II sporulation protein P [Thermoflavimicrobium dichotomicum]SFJ09639.1 stage II sporulation protein P [Thermoflavimicrobium dichotomicum]